MRQRVLAIAKCEQGVKENPPGSNSQKYGIWYGVDKQPWCAMFVCWVFWLAGRAIPKIQNEYGSAFVPFIYDHFKKANKLTENPQAADMVIYDWNGDKKGDHIGIFDKWNEKGKSFWENLDLSS